MIFNMNLIQALILGIVEGITEFLPISSTAHLILLGRVLGITSTDFVKTFGVVIQLGAILAVVVIYWRTFLRRWAVNGRIILAFIPTGVLGFLLYSRIKNLLGDPLVAIGALFLGGIILILFEHWHKESADAVENLSAITYPQAFLIGLAQTVSMIPGVSRSAATILGGMVQRIKRETIVEFSFLLAVPTMLAATGYDLLKNFHSLAGSSGNGILLLVGFLAAFLSALVAVSWLIRYIKNHKLTAFGIYRIVIALVFLLLYI